jgi:uncharacterized protein (TIGR00266 family)
VQIKLAHRPARTIARVSLAAGDAIRTEPGAMLTMRGPLSVQTDGPRNDSGGLLGAVKRKVLGGESLFTNTYRANGGDGEVVLGQPLCGDMVVHELSSTNELITEAGSLIASALTVSVDTKFEGVKGLFSGEGLFFLRMTGYGPAILGAFGAIDTIELDGEMIVDTGHLVAFTNGIGYQVEKSASNWITSLLSGEGMVLRLQGRGTVYLQTRNRQAFGGAVGRHLASR